MFLDALPPAHRIAALMERIYGSGMTTTSGGNLSVLEESGDLWITPSGIDKGSLRPEDIVQVKPDGRAAGRHRPSVELPFHRLIYQRRPDLRAIVHAHPPALIAFSIARRTPDIGLVPGARLACGEVGMAEYGLPGSPDLGEKIAQAFGAGPQAVMLENHGAVAGGRDLFQAFRAFEALDHCARVEIEARRIGSPRSLSPRELELFRQHPGPQLGELTPRGEVDAEREARRGMCQLARRACDQGLFTSAQGTFSQRLGEGSFLVTPHLADRRHLEPGDLVRIEGDLREAGKTPSRSAVLHQHIYRCHPEVGAVVVARPPSIMAFAVTGQPFDTRIIPECYLLLRNVARLPFGSTFLEPEKAAAVFTRETPLAIVESDCLVVTGTSLIHAFDRLEVAEYSARALIACRAIGEVVEIPAERIRELGRAFEP